MATYRDLISYRKLLEDSVGILTGAKWPVFPNGDRSKPSNTVCIHPTDFAIGYWHDFWNEVVGPTLGYLNALETPVGGWGQNVVAIDAALKAAIVGSRFERRVIMNR